jgi:hypothetical protein
VLAVHGAGELLDLLWAEMQLHAQPADRRVAPSAIRRANLEVRPSFLANYIPTIVKVRSKILLRGTKNQAQLLKVTASYCPRSPVYELLEALKVYKNGAEGACAYISRPCVCIYDSHIYDSHPTHSAGVCVCVWLMRVSGCFDHA